MNTLELAIRLWTALIFGALICLSGNKTTTEDNLPKFPTCDDLINSDNLILSFEIHSVEGLPSFLRIKKIPFIPT